MLSKPVASASMMMRPCQTYILPLFFGIFAIPFESQMDPTALTCLDIPSQNGENARIAKMCLLEKNCIFLVKTCHKMKANKLILSGREQKNPFGDWVKLYDWFVCLLGKSLESWTAEIERSGLSSRFISLFTTFLQQEKRFIVKLCFCRLTCLECQKKNHGDPKPVFPLGHPHTSSETNYFQRPTSCKDRNTKNN